MNSAERRECKASGEWPEGYKGSVEERLDQMQEDFKALAYAAMQNDDNEQAKLCLAAIDAVWVAQHSLEAMYGEAQWSAVLAMQPSAEKPPAAPPSYQGKNPPA